jgi:ATP-dependent DNA helicase RecG
VGREEKKPWIVTPDTPVQYLKGVGEGRAALLHANGLKTAHDLLYFVPYRFEDRRRQTTVKDLPFVTGPVVLRGRVLSAASRVSPIKRMRMFEAMLDDGTGSVPLLWFNQPYLADQIKRNDRISIFGQPRISSYSRRLVIENPQWEAIDPEGEVEDEGSIVPVYSSISTISSKNMRRIVQQALPAVAALEDPFDAHLRTRLGVIGLSDAIVSLHAPTELADDPESVDDPAHRRVILQEFFAFQLALRIRRSQEEVRSKKRKTVIDDGVRQRVREVLPFKLTDSQRRVLKEIATDMQGEKPMYRLLQGDVGSGKTIVAMVAAMIAIANGHQAALLAPTEILAEQHFERVTQLFADAGVVVGKLTGSSSPFERKRVLQELKSGEIHLLVGTHAMLEEKVIFNKLALAVVDEQHRFGVAQRQQLFDKGDMVDVLVMTATPIPRSLAIALYGDLDLSVIDELPPGRTPIKTKVRGTAQLKKVFRFVEEQLAEGAQAYVVYPLIEESEKVDLKALMNGVEEVRVMLPGRRIARLHGRMSSEEKEAIMRSFGRGEIDVLVSTTVIEVGIDVANASVMLIMDSDRFGLAQLHQLRGRVGRGERPSYCVLFRDEKASEEAKKRLRDFEAARDGFAVAEMDLQNRGEGDMLGTRQSGLPRFRFGSIVRDVKLMELARRVAVEEIEKSGLAVARALLARLAPETAEALLRRD